MVVGSGLSSILISAYYHQYSLILCRAAAFMRLTSKLLASYWQVTQLIDHFFHLLTIDHVRKLKQHANSGN